MFEAQCFLLMILSFITVLFNKTSNVKKMSDYFDFIHDLYTYHTFIQRRSLKERCSNMYLFIVFHNVDSFMDSIVISLVCPLDGGSPLSSKLLLTFSILDPRLLVGKGPRRSLPYLVTL